MRKQAVFDLGIANLDGSGKIKVLTTCPACLQGLSRYRDQIDLEISYPVIELAKHKIGSDWETQFIHQVQHDGIERVLL